MSRLGHYGPYRVTVERTAKLRRALAVPMGSAEVAVLLGVHVRTARRLLRDRGILAAVRCMEDPMNDPVDRRWCPMCGRLALCRLAVRSGGREVTIGWVCEFHVEAAGNEVRSTLLGLFHDAPSPPRPPGC